MVRLTWKWANNDKCSAGKVLHEYKTLYSCLFRKWQLYFPFTQAESYATMLFPVQAQLWLCVTCLNLQQTVCLWMNRMTGSNCLHSVPQTKTRICSSSVFHSISGFYVTHYRVSWELRQNLICNFIHCQIRYSKWLPYQMCVPVFVQQG